MILIFWIVFGMINVGFGVWMCVCGCGVGVLVGLIGGVGGGGI